MHVLVPIAKVFFWDTEPVHHPLQFLCPLSLRTMDLPPVPISFQGVHIQVLQFICMSATQTF